ncbi:MAG: hypothetical protein HFE45_08785 [Oscillospiraceae bacterium]|jgi:hypothetical protein|nr:hypothetical protein [Oscillospiraceae bacterium]
MKGRIFGFARALCFIGAAALAVAAFQYALDSLENGQSEENLRQLEETLRRAAVACYAAEGAYPATLEDLVGRYGIQISDDYTVHYTSFAENLVPDITVLENTP